MGWGSSCFSAKCVIFFVADLGGLDPNDVCCLAAENGHFEFMKWAVERTFPTRYGLFLHNFILHQNSKANVNTVAFFVPIVSQLSKCRTFGAIAREATLWPLCAPKKLSPQPLGIWRTKCVLPVQHSPLSKRVKSYWLYKICG